MAKHVYDRSENLEIIKRNNDKFVAKMASINSKPSEKEGLELLAECNELLSYTNSGAYGPHNDAYQAENDRLADAYRDFWRRF